MSKQRTIDRALALAKTLGMNQASFARAMGVLAQHVTNWKARGMPPEHLPRAARVLGCSVDYLVGLAPFPYDDDGRGDALPLLGAPAEDVPELDEPERMSDEQLNQAFQGLPRDLKISLLSTVRRAWQSSPPQKVQPVLQMELPGARERHLRRKTANRGRVKRNAP